MLENTQGAIKNGHSRETVEDNFIFYVYTVKHAYVVTSIKQSPVLKGHLFLVLS
jgi:hypothetical protein